MKKKINKNGFTLIELIIVSVTMVVVSMAIYTTLSTGLKIWRKASFEIVEENADVFFEKFTADLRNAVMYNNITFAGSADGFELPTLVMSRNLNSRAVGKVIYSYDKDGKSVRRCAQDFSDIFNGGGPGSEALQNVSSARFQYYTYNAQTKEYLWQDEIADQRMPLAIRIELEIGNNDKVVRLVKTVNIPISN